MSATAVAPPRAPAAEPSLAQLGRHVVSWFRKNIPAVIVSAAVGMVVGFVTNIWITAVYYQGTNGATAAGHGAATAALLSGVATTVVFGVYGYYRAVGPTKFSADIRGLPSALMSLGTREGKPGWVHLLWGAATTMVATTVISPGVGAILAIGLLASAPGYLGRVLSTLLMRVWSQILQRVAPTRKARPAGVVSMTVGVIGASVAMLAGYLIPAASVTGPLPTRLVVAVGCGVGAVVIGQSGQGTPGANAALKLLLLIVGGVVLIESLHPLIAWATDGGQLECGGDWAKYLTQCQGADGVVKVAAAGTAASTIAAPLGNALGHAAGGDDGGSGDGGGSGDDGGSGDSGGGQGDGEPGAGPGPLHPPPPPPHFPHVYMKGGKVMIETANGVILSATPNADGKTVGPWSATNLHTQSGGSIDNRITNDDGSTTTNYADGTTVTSGGPDGGSQSWGPDGTYTVATPDGQATTTHPDNSVDVRFPDGTVTTTLPDGTQTVTSPDGTVVKINSDGNFTYNPDGSVDATLANGDTVHQSTDGTTVSTDPNGIQTVTNNDGTVTITRPDGSSETKWPDGSSEVVAVDGTKTITQRDGTTYIHNPDGSVQTNNPDGSDRTRSADGSISQTGSDGVQTTWNKDGSVDIMHPGGTLVTHNPDGSVDTTYPNGTTVTQNPDGTTSAITPSGTDVGDPNAILRNLDTRAGYMSDAHPEVFQAVQDLQRQVAANGGVWTPAELATLMAIQNRADLGGDQRDHDRATNQDAFQQADIDARTARNEHQADMDKEQAKLQAKIDTAEGYIQKEMLNLPTEQWTKIQAALDHINSHSPNSQDMATLRNIRATIFLHSQGEDPKGKQLDDAVNAALAPPRTPPPEIKMDIYSQVDRQRQFLQDHMYGLPPAQQEIIHKYLDRDYSNATMADLNQLQRLSHMTFNGMQGRSEASAAQHEVDALNADAAMVATQRVNSLAQGTAMAIGVPLALGGAAGVLGLTNVAAVIGAGTLPGAAAAAAGSAAVVFGAQGLTGAINGYYGSEYGGGKQGAVWGAASAMLPVNTAAAILHGDGVGSVAFGVFQDTGNVLGALGATHQVQGWLSEPPPKGVLGRVYGDESNIKEPGDSKFLADRANGGRNVSDLRDAQLAAYDDPNYQTARQNFDNAQAALADQPRSRELQQQLKDARSVLDSNPHQQQLDAVASRMTTDYQSRNLIKQAPLELQKPYVDYVDNTNARVNDLRNSAMNDAGFRIGGREFTNQDVVPVRNASSTSAPMDNDMALNDLNRRRFAQAINDLPPGTDPALRQAMNERLVQGVNDQTLTINGKRVSQAEWNTQAQAFHDDAYRQVTGRDPGMAFQTVTTGGHLEAYPDLNMLMNDPVNHPPNPAHAESSGAVTTYKGTHNDNVMPHELWNAQQETARGAAKDIASKLIPQLQAQGASPEVVARAQAMGDFLKDAGNGSYLPSQANSLAQQHFGTDIRGLNARTGDAITAAIKLSPPSPSVSLLDSMAAGVKPSVKLVMSGMKLDRLEHKLDDMNKYDRKLQ